MFDEVNLSTHLNLTDLANLLSNRKAKVKYNYYDVDIEKERSELYNHVYDLQTIIDFNNADTIDDMYIKIAKYKIKTMIIDEANIVSHLQSILWHIRKTSGEKFCMYVFKKYNKIMGIDINTDAIILDHPIDIILSSCFRSLVTVNKFLLQRDLSYDEYITLIAHKIATNIDNICQADITIFENLLLNNPDNIDDCAVCIIDKIIVHYCNFTQYNGHSILRIVNTESFYKVAIASGNTDVIENIIKFAIDMYSYYTITFYNNACARVRDFNNMDIEKYFRYTDSPHFYNFFDKLCDNEIYEIKLDKICKSGLDSFPVFTYFLKKYYRLSDINDIDHNDLDLLPVDTIRNLIINSMENVNQQSIISITSNMQFIKHIIPDIFDTNSLALSHYYHQLCWLIDERYTVLTHNDTTRATCPNYDKNTKIICFCNSIKKEIDSDVKKNVNNIKEEIDNNIKSGLLDYNKIIGDIIRDRHGDVNDSHDIVFRSVENILGKQYLSIDDFDLLFMKVMNKIDFICVPQKYSVEYFCRIINNLISPEYYDTDTYKNNYLSYLLNFAIDYIAIDGDFIILPGTNINLHISDFKFYPFFALLHTTNPQIISYVIDNYNLSDLSASILASFINKQGSVDDDANGMFLIVKLVKRYLPVLKSLLHNCTDKDYSIAGTNFGYIENISQIIIE